MIVQPITGNPGICAEIERWYEAFPGEFWADYAESHHNWPVWCCRILWNLSQQKAKWWCYAHCTLERFPPWKRHNSGLLHNSGSPGQCVFLGLCVCVHECVCVFLLHVRLYTLFYSTYSYIEFIFVFIYIEQNLLKCPMNVTKFTSVFFFFPMDTKLFTKRISSY